MHTTVFCVDNAITEFQIRTEEMHNKAEAGIAAHWAWEMCGKPLAGTKLQSPKFNWVNQLREWHKGFNKNSASDKSFLEALKIDFFKDRVFVLTPKGDVVDLPEGATPIDFAYHIHSEIGDHMSGAKVNGRIVSFDCPLSSGDIVEIIIQKNKKPSSEWLSSAKSSLAKNHIRSFLKKGGYLMGTRVLKQKRSIEIIVIAKNRVGLLKDVSAVFSSISVNIQELFSKQDSDYSKVHIIFTPKTSAELYRIKMNLKKIKSVEQVSSRPIIT